MLLTEAGIVIAVKSEKANAKSPIVASREFSPNITVSRFEQSQNAPLPMLVTPFSIMTFSTSFIEKSTGDSSNPRTYSHSYVPKFVVTVSVHVAVAKLQPLPEKLSSSSSSSFPASFAITICEKVGNAYL